MTKLNTQEPRNDGKYNSKANTVCILKILQEYSDGNIILPTSRIIELMDSVYGLHVDRRTVYSSIDILQKLGYSIESYDENGIGYCLTDKPFDALEIKLLIDSIQLNTVVPKQNEKDIVNKLMKLIPNEDNRHVMNRLVGSLKKEKNMTLFYMLDTIDLAMQKKKKIEFDYLTKDNTLTHFVVTPMTIIQINYHYYVICSNHPEKQNIIFRVKDMKNLLESTEDAGPYTYFKGYTELNETGIEFNYINAKLECSTSIEDIFLDTFDNFILKSKKLVYSEDGKTFTVEVYGTPDAISRWALSFPDKCEVIEPLELREAVINKLKNNKYGV